MARKRRVEYPGATYHIISRGNYRKDLFLEQGSGASFEATLIETVERCGWEVYAYVIMSNHFHLAVRTPEPNLVAGMKWLQGVFATRFNRYRGERGHVFQGRYKSLLVEEDQPLSGLIDYITLNPVRAGLCTVGELGGYELSSYPKLWDRHRPRWLQRKTLLSLRNLPDTRRGLRMWTEQLEAAAQTEPLEGAALSRKYDRGWFIGSAKAKKELVENLCETYPDAEWETGEYRELRKQQWENRVLEELKRLGKSEDDVEKDRKGAAWKAEVARILRRDTTAGNPWIAKRLRMGHPSRVSNLIREVKG